MHICTGGHVTFQTYFCFQDSYLLCGDLEVRSGPQPPGLRIARPLPQLILQLMRFSLLRELELAVCSDPPDRALVRRLEAEDADLAAGLTAGCSALRSFGTQAEVAALL